MAIQMPRNFSEPSHTAINEVIQEGVWNERLTPLTRHEPCKPPEYYWDMLALQVKTEKRQ
ncbi:MAG: hypothetical protein ACXWM7_01690 [Parachlamydiaceae bacterium]